MQTSDFVNVSDLCKSFGKVKALDNVSVGIGSGSIIGLIGANGCGKSTLLRHIIGMYLPTSGSVEIFGVEARGLSSEQMSRIGYVHQEGQLLEWMSVRQQIDYVAAYYDGWNRELQGKFVSQFDIDMKARVGKLSPGKRQQLAILLAICHEPELLILDEPASGLDPIARRHFLDLLLELIQVEGRTIIISSHILSDIEKVIDHIIVMDKGRIIRDCDFDQLREGFCRVKFSGLEEGVELKIENVIDAEYSAGEALLVLCDADTGLLRSYASELGCKCEISALSLEDIYKVVIEKHEAELLAGKA